MEKTVTIGELYKVTMKGVTKSFDCVGVFSEWTDKTKLGSVTYVKLCYRDLDKNGLPKGRLRTANYVKKYFWKHVEVAEASSEQKRAWVKVTDRADARKAYVDNLRAPLQGIKEALKQRLPEETPEWPLGKDFDYCFIAREYLSCMKIEFTLRYGAKDIVWTLDSLIHFNEVAKEEAEKRGLSLSGMTFKRHSIEPVFKFD